MAARPVTASVGEGTACILFQLANAVQLTPLIVR